jgi:Tfp pilus assembly protein PilP
MKGNLALILMMAAAAFAQSPTVVEKPAAKTSAATVKVLPSATPKGIKPSPTTVKVAPAVTKPAVVSVQPVSGKTNSGPQVSTTKPVAATPVKVEAKPKNQSAAAAPSKTSVIAAKRMPVQSESKHASAKPAHVVAVKADAKQKSGAAQTKEAKVENKEPSKPTTAAGRRDPFVSPIVSIKAGGSGCSSGKRCLAIDQIALRGVVKSDTGMIAVVVNSMDKAYFLRENDPVFNGYVLKITGDSIVFKESFRDRLGKPLTRDVTKTIMRPVA